MHDDLRLEVRDGVHLRPSRPADVGALYMMVECNRARVGRFMWWVELTHVELTHGEADIGDFVAGAQQGRADGVSLGVAHAGLDPRQVQSGTSPQRQPRISRRGNARLRAALYMPALTASRHDPAARRHHEALAAAGKTPMQANVAVMRKLLHGIHGILHRRVAYEGARLFSRGAPTPPPNTAGQPTCAA